jgi:hypothetical protein
MKQLASAAIVAMGMCGLVAVANPQAPMPMPSARMGIEIDVEPAKDMPGKFMVSSTITDLESNTVVARPRLLIGDAPAKIETGNDGKWMLQISVAASSASGRSVYDATFTREGKIVSRQRFAVNLGTRA